MYEKNQDSDEPRRQDIEIPQDNTEDVPYSPQADTGFGVKEVTIDEQTIEIHETHNLPNAFAVFIQPPVLRAQTQEQLDFLTSIYGPRIKAGGFEPVFERLAQQYPKLYAKAAALVGQAYAEADAKNDAAELFGKDSQEYAREVEHWRRAPDEIHLRDYFFSKAFDAMAIISPEIDLEAPLSHLCED